MQIIKCTKDNLQQVANFYDDVVLYLTQTVNYPKWRYKEYPSLQSVTEDASQGSQYACLVDGNVVGAFVINLDPRGDYYVGDWQANLQEGEYLVIHSFATHPNFYKKGVATAMLNFCKQFALQNGLKAIRIDVVPTNTPAIAFYLKNGFTFAGDKDLHRNFDDIPTFCLYEYNF